jgi:hypothetical protein
MTQAMTIQIARLMLEAISKGLPSRLNFDVAADDSDTLIRVTRKPVTEWLMILGVTTVTLFTAILSQVTFSPPFFFVNHNHTS